MANPLLIVIESLRRLARPGHLARGLPPVVQLAAAVSTLAVIGFSALTFLGDVVWDGKGTPTPPPASPFIEDTPNVDVTPSMTATSFPTGSLAVVRVDSCVWAPSDSADSVAELILTLEIKGNREFSQQVAVRATTDDREWLESFKIDEQEWVPEKGVIVAYPTVGLDLVTDDLEKRHDITVRVDPNDVTEAFAPSERETSVRVFIPATLPKHEDEDVPDCASPVP